MISPITPYVKVCFHFSLAAASSLPAPEMILTPAITVKMKKAIPPKRRIFGKKNETREERVGKFCAQGKVVPISTPVGIGVEIGAKA